MTRNCLWITPCLAIALAASGTKAQTIPSGCCPCKRDGDACDASAPAKKAQASGTRTRPNNCCTATALTVCSACSAGRCAQETCKPATASGCCHACKDAARASASACCGCESCAACPICTPCAACQVLKFLSGHGSVEIGFTLGMPREKTGGVAAGSRPSCPAPSVSAPGAGRWVTHVYSVADLLDGWDSGEQDDLIHVLMSGVSPQTWAEHGGAGTVEYCSAARALVIHQRPEVHAQIRELLGGLRRAQDQADRADAVAAGPPPGIGTCPGGDVCYLVPIQPPPTASPPNRVSVAVRAPAPPNGPACPDSMHGLCGSAGCPTPPIGPGPDASGTDTNRLILVGQIPDGTVRSSPQGMCLAVPPGLPVPPVSLNLSQVPAACTVAAVEDDGRWKLAVSCGSGSRALCPELVLDRTGMGRVTITGAAKQIQLEGTGLVARTDRMTLMRSGERVVLEGHAHVKYHRGGERAEIRAESVVINLADGSVQLTPRPRPVASVTAPRPAGLAVIHQLMGWVP